MYFHSSTTIFLNNINSTLVTNILIYPIVLSLNIPLVIKKIKRFYVIKKHKRTNNSYFNHNNILFNIVNNQNEANKLFENPDINIYDKYAHIIKCLVFCGLYNNILSNSIIYTVISFIFLYIIEKIQIINIYCIPVNTSYILNEYFFKACFLSYIVSNYIGEKYFKMECFINNTNLLNNSNICYDYKSFYMFKLDANIISYTLVILSYIIYKKLNISSFIFANLKYNQFTKIVNNKLNSNNKLFNIIQKYKSEKFKRRSSLNYTSIKSNLNFSNSLKHRIYSNNYNTLNPISKELIIN